MIILDTCSLIWWTLDPSKLSPQAKRACDKIPETGAAISSISIWEIGIKVKTKKLEIALPLEEYVSRLKQTNLEIIPVDETVWLKNLELKWNNRDPADRTIVATALIKKAPLVTKDDQMKQFYSKVIW